MNVLLVGIKNHHSAIEIICSERDILPFEKRFDKFVPDTSEVTRQNKVVTVRRGLCVSEILFQRVCRRRCHSRAHIVYIADTHINYRSGAKRRNFRHIRYIFVRQQQTARPRYRPLRRRRTHRAVIERVTVLPFRRAEMTACYCHGSLCKAAVYRHRRDYRRFNDRRTRSVQSKITSPAITAAVSRTDALIEQITCENEVNIFVAQVCFFEDTVHRLLLHLRFRFFVCLLSEIFVV